MLTRGDSEEVAAGYLARRPDGRVEILCDVGWARLHPTLTEPSGALAPLGREVFAAAEATLARREAANRPGCSCRAVAADRAADLLKRSERFRAAGNARVADRLLVEARVVAYVRDSLPGGSEEARSGRGGPEPHLGPERAGGGRGEPGGAPGARGAARARAGSRAEFEAALRE